MSNCNCTKEFKVPVLEGDFMNDQIVIERLSCDPKYLYEIVRAVKTGYVSERLANLHPGKIAHSCWLTTASRIMRL